MATITMEISVLSAERAWAALSDFGGAHRAFAGVLTDCGCDGDTRTVTFTNGIVVKERLVGIDQARRRIAYFVVDGPFEHHNAAFEIRGDGPGEAAFIWTTDLLPDEAAAMVEPLMDAGMKAFAQNLEAAA